MMAESPVSVLLAELTHTGVTVDANYFPLACGLLAAYAKQELGEALDIEICKYPNDLAAYLDRARPRVAGFSNYSWCLNLNYAYARRIKERYPDTVIVFGGPNYAIEPEQQAAFLCDHPAIDFYIDGEGEIAFVGLLRALAEVGFDAEALKRRSGGLPGSTHALVDGQLVRGPQLPRIVDVGVLPSPYLNGLMDKFFDPILTPVIQTSRGCPYTCAYCHDGINYMTKLARFPQERINAEIQYVFERRQVLNLTLADLNFGIFKEDLDTTIFVAGLRDRFGWPAFLDVAVAKQAKARVLEIAGRLKGGLYVGASVQSTDSEVLDIIKRRNVPLDQMIELAQSPSHDAYTSFSEVILCLPGDTLDKHMRSVFDMLDLGMEEIRMYQFILLPGTLGGSDEYRKTYGYETRYRVLPRCFGIYRAFGSEFPVFEYHEVCVGNTSMPNADYVRCREFNLTVELFNNGGVLRELFQLLRRHDLARSVFFAKLMPRLDGSADIQTVFRLFREDEARNFYPDRQAVEDFLATDAAMEAYRSGVLGSNQIFLYRSMALLNHFEEICRLAFATAREMLEESGLLDEEMRLYLDELEVYILAKKGNLLTTEDVAASLFHFDFVGLAACDFADDPFAHRRPEGVSIAFTYEDERRRHIEGYYIQYGRSLRGFSHYVHRGGPMASLYRNPAFA